MVDDVGDGDVVVMSLSLSVSEEADDFREVIISCDDDDGGFLCLLLLMLLVVISRVVTVAKLVAKAFLDGRPLTTSCRR